MTLHPDHRRAPNPARLGIALSVAPLAVGCAAGILLAGRVNGRTRQGVASGLLALGVIAVMPLAIDTVSRALDHLAFRRGSQRRLERIRDSGACAVGDEDADFVPARGGADSFDGLRS